MTDDMRGCAGQLRREGDVVEKQMYSMGLEIEKVVGGGALSIWKRLTVME